MSQFPILSVHPIEETEATIEAHGKVTIRYSFDPPLPPNTHVKMTAESESTFRIHSIDWQDRNEICPPSGQAIGGK